jgi:hypothetical protein
MNNHADTVRYQTLFDTTWMLRRVAISKLWTWTNTNGGSICVVAGELGCGKTQLVRRVLETRFGNDEVTSMHTLPSLYMERAGRVEFLDTGADTFKSSFQSFVNTCSRTGVRVLLLDDFDLLSSVDRTTVMSCVLPPKCYVVVVVCDTKRHNVVLKKAKCVVALETIAFDVQCRFVKTKFDKTLTTRMVDLRQLTLQSCFSGNGGDVFCDDGFAIAKQCLQARRVTESLVAFLAHTYFAELLLRTSVVYALPACVSSSFSRKRVQVKSLLQWERRVQTMSDGVWLRHVPEAVYVIAFAACGAGGSPHHAKSLVCHYNSATPLYTLSSYLPAHNRFCGEKK